MRIRRVEIGDLHQIEQIEKREFEYYAVHEHSINPLLDLFPDGQRVLDDNGKIAAYFLTEKHNFSPLLPRDHDVSKTHRNDGIYLYVSTFCVEENYKGKKIGSHMARKLEEVGKKEDCDGIYLAIKRDSEAIDFWKKMGYFVIKETAWNPIPGKERECYVMAKSLR